MIFLFLFGIFFTGLLITLYFVEYNGKLFNLWKNRKVRRKISMNRKKAIYPRNCLSCRKSNIIDIYGKESLYCKLIQNLVEFDYCCEEYKIDEKIM